MVRFKKRGHKRLQKKITGRIQKTAANSRGSKPATTLSRGHQSVAKRPQHTNNTSVMKSSFKTVFQTVKEVSSTVLVFGKAVEWLIKQLHGLF